MSVVVRSPRSARGPGDGSKALKKLEASKHAVGKMDGGHGYERVERGAFVCCSEPLTLDTDRWFLIQAPVYLLTPPSAHPPSRAPPPAYPLSYLPPIYLHDHPPAPLRSQENTMLTYSPELGILEESSSGTTT